MIYLLIEEADPALAAFKKIAISPLKSRCSSFDVELLRKEPQL
jgi:hypothetical protein